MKQKKFAGDKRGGITSKDAHMWPPPFTALTLVITKAVLLSWREDRFSTLIETKKHSRRNAF